MEVWFDFQDGQLFRPVAGNAICIQQVYETPLTSPEKGLRGDKSHPSMSAAELPLASPLLR